MAFLDPFANPPRALTERTTDSITSWLIQLPTFGLLTREGNTAAGEWLVCTLGETIMREPNNYNPCGWFEPDLLYDNLSLEDRLQFDVVWQQLTIEYHELWNQFTFRSLNGSDEGFYRYDYQLFGGSAILYFYSLPSHARGDQL